MHSSFSSLLGAVVVASAIHASNAAPVPGSTVSKRQAGAADFGSCPPPAIEVAL
jgi:hypothetical protein